MRTVPKFNKFRFGVVVVGVLVATGAAGETTAPKVTLQGVVMADAGRAGGSVQAAFEVALPKGFHVNSDEPREEFLIPTVLLVRAPAGVRVQEVSYPEPTLFKARFSKQALSVFESRFRIGVSLGFAEELEPGGQKIVATLRYQACTERVCYPPAFRTAELEISVEPKVVDAMSPPVSE